MTPIEIITITTLTAFVSFSVGLYYGIRVAAKLIVAGKVKNVKVVV